MYWNKRPPRLEGWGRFADEVYVDGGRWLRPWEQPATTIAENLDITTHMDTDLPTTETPDMFVLASTRTIITEREKKDSCR